MAEDLLTRIQRELQERMEALRGTVAEHDRLQADLRALDAEPEPSSEPEPSAALDCEPALPTEPLVARPPEPEPPPEPPGEPGPEATVVCFPARDLVRTHAASRQAARPMAAAPRPARERAVSPKVIRLMLAPRRPALERSGIARVTAHGVLKRVAPVEVDELDAQPDHTRAELYEHAI
jgi:hypothetical protein